MEKQLSPLQERVLAFQKRHDLKQDHIVGRETWGRVEDIEEAFTRLEDKYNETLDDLANCRNRERPAHDDNGGGLSPVLVGAAIVAAALFVGLALL